MRLAVLADIHANLPALEAVLAAVDELRPEAVVCAGDLVGYNAQPAECLDLLRRVTDAVVAGNHDRDTVSGEPAPGTSPSALRLQKWTRGRLSAEQVTYLRELPSHVVVPAGFVLAHGCYLNDTFVTGYVTSTMLEANLRAIAARADWPRVGFCGHTHIPLCGWMEGSRTIEHRLDSPARWPKSAEAVLVNPGAVGQPRDGDPRASFAVVDLDARTVCLHRVSYDLDRATRAILDAGLPGSLADRLRTGR